MLVSIADAHGIKKGQIASETDGETSIERCRHLVCFGIVASALFAETHNMVKCGNDPEQNISKTSRSWTGSIRVMYSNLQERIVCSTWETSRCTRNNMHEMLRKVTKGLVQLGACAPLPLIRRL